MTTDEVRSQLEAIADEFGELTSGKKVHGIVVLFSSESGEPVLVSSGSTDAAGGKMLLEMALSSIHDQGIVQ